MEPNKAKEEAKSNFSLAILKKIGLGILFLLYLLIVLGTIEFAYDGYNLPEVKAYDGEISKRDCHGGKVSGADIKLKGLDQYFDIDIPFYFGSCRSFYKEVRTGNRVKLLSSDDGRVWSMELNDDVIRSYDEYAARERLVGPFSVVGGILIGIFGPVLYWAIRRDKKRKAKELAKMQTG